MISVRSHTQPGGIIELAVAGEIDMATIGQVDSALTTALARDGAAGIVVNLAGVTFLDSSGLSALDRAYATAAGRGIPLRVTNLQRGVRRVLELSGMLGLLTSDPG
jgi:anti-anti-sigma factor